MKIAFTFSIFLLLATIAFGQKSQTIRGRILDEASRSPLIGATVLLLQEPGQNPIGASTDMNGDFRISGVPLGRQTLKISSIGYENKLIPNIIVTSGKEVIMDVVLTESVSQLTEAEIVYDRKKDKKVTNNEYSLLSARSFNLDDTKRYAGALGDPSRMAANFAGVVAGNDSRNDIVVRGNSPTGMLFQLEGLNIPNPNHFGALNATGGPVSMLNNNNLDKSDFLTAAFPAQYGNALAGVFDLRLRNGNNEKKEFLGQIGFNGFEFGAEGPFSSKSKASYLVNYRYSTLSVFQKIGVNFGTGSATPNYQDLNYKVFVPVGKKGKLSFFGLMGQSDVKFLGNEADTSLGNFYANENENTIVKYQTGIFGTSYEHQINPKTFAKITLGFSGTNESFHGDSISVESRKEFKSGEAAFKTGKYSIVSSLQHKFNRRNTLLSGFYVDFMQFNLLNRDFMEGGLRSRTNVDINKNAVLTQAYTQWKHRFTEKLVLSSGLHFQHFTLGNASAIEPRVGLKYSIGARQSIAIGYGLHNQIQPIYTYFVETPTPNGTVLTNKNLGFTMNQHSVLTYENSLNENTTFKIEAYYQAISKAPVSRQISSFSALNIGSSFAPSNEDSLVNKGKGENYGLEMTLERNFSKGYFFLITGSLFNSRYQGSDNVWRNTAYNTKHVLNVLAGKEFRVGKSKTNVLAISVKGSRIGGRYLTPIDFQKSGVQGSAYFIEDRAFSEKQKDYLRFDLKISYRKEYAKSTLEFAIDLQNVTNHQNIFRQDYNRRTNKLVTEYQQGFFPVPFVRYTF